MPQVVENAGGYGGGPRSSEDRGAALSWAVAQTGSGRYRWRCERFVEQAYGAAPVFNSAAQAEDQLSLHREPISAAPAGALVYFRGDAANQHLGHVGLSLGNGKMISALATVRTTDVRHSAYWSRLYVGWADAPVTWPGRFTAPPLDNIDPSVSIRIGGPAAGQTISGVTNIYVDSNAPGVLLRAYYASDPRDATTRAWHDIGLATLTAGSWVLAWDTTSIPNQGQAEWGTVAVEAVAIDAQGDLTGNRDSRRYVIDNPVPPPPPPQTGQTWSETVGGIAHTWTDYTSAGGTQGPSIAAYQTVQVACRVQGFKVADGNTWWYRVASAPWSSQYYASADAFYNNGQTSGSLTGTPFVDSAVALC